MDAIVFRNVLVSALELLRNHSKELYMAKILFQEVQEVLLRLC